MTADTNKTHRHTNITKKFTITYNDALSPLNHSQQLVTTQKNLKTTQNHPLPPQQTTPTQKNFATTHNHTLPP